MILRRHAATLDELAAFGQLFAEESRIVSETFDAEAATVVVDFDMVGQRLDGSVDRPPSELVSAEPAHLGGTRSRWRSPVLRGTVTVRRAVRMRRAPGVRDPLDDVALWAERRSSGRFLVGVGDVWVWTSEIDVTSELTDTVVGVSVVEEVCAADGRVSAVAWDLPSIA